jgi:hypothetical protein
VRGLGDGAGYVEVKHGFRARPRFRRSEKLCWLKVYQEKLAGPAPRFPVEMEDDIDAYLKGYLTPKDTAGLVNPLGISRPTDEGTATCPVKLAPLSTYKCKPSASQQNNIHPIKNESGRFVYSNQ